MADLVELEHRLRRLEDMDTDIKKMAEELEWYCLKDRCDAVGRSCTDGEGNCANLGEDDDPFWACTKACHLGSDPDANDFPCRKTPATERMTCMPL